MIKYSVKADTTDLQSLISRLQNPRKALDQIGQMLVRSTRTRIAQTKVSHEGKPWAPWSLATLIARMKEGTASRGLLYNSRTLWKSIDHKVQGNSVTVSANTPYASFLQEGTSRMPARPFIGISKQDDEFALAILRRHLSAR